MLVTLKAVTLHRFCNLSGKSPYHTIPYPYPRISSCYKFTRVSRFFFTGSKVHKTSTRVLDTFHHKQLQERSIRQRPTEHPIATCPTYHFSPTS